MQAILIGYGDWNENSIEVVELVDFSVEGVKKHFIEWAKKFENFEQNFGCSVEEIDIEPVQTGQYLINVGGCVLSEFGFEFLNLDEMLSLGEKVLKTNDEGVELVDGSVVKMKELEYEWNETEYSVLIKHSGNDTYYKVVKQ